jgi:lysosome membrane protein 2
MEQRKLIITDIVLVILGLVLIVIGCGLIPFFNQKIKDTVEQSVQLVNGSDAFNAWKEPEAPIYLSHYFFNITNPDEVIYNNSKPCLQEIGPFTYREYRNKTDIDFTEDSDKIHYKEHKYYVFEPNQSAGLDESVVICTVNIPVLTVSTQVRFYFHPFQFAFREFFKFTGEHLFQCHSVKELLFGYTPIFVEKLDAFLRRWHIPYQLNFTFGIYSGPTANGTDDGDLEIFTGVKDIKKLGLVDKWKGSSSLPYWHDSCNNISGSDGTLWHPFVEKTDTLYIFNTDLCRSLYITYSSSATISSSNIPTYHFTPPPTVMADPQSYPANKCYCSPYDNNGTFCLGAGVLNVSNCKQNAPIIMSEPHFLEAPEYKDEVIGLNPDPKKHQTLIDVEPNTGLVLNAAKRIQVNIYITKLKGFADTDQFTDGLVFPILWFDEHATIPDDVADKFYHTVILPIKFANGITYGLIALGGFLVLCALVLLIVICVKRRSDQEPTRATNADDDEPLLTG